MSGVDEHATLRAVVAAGRPEALSEGEIERLLSHAADCDGCAAELNDFAAAAILAQAPAVPFDPERSAQVKERVLARTRIRIEPAARVRASPRAGMALGSGWLAAAAMGIALITHHGFHEPLRAGWLVAAGFAILALGLAVHSHAQRQRLAELEQRLGLHEQEPHDR